ncbi:tetratricopeptide repeat protein [Taibaiella chishuiensis]|uniref:Tetratricopeptide repeat protein n=1 Tax=Taibaiella chishuiensis TaxID=1434707 RepID=A0A2P8D642_9BACT|nr:tetratricopeptide repeat protein [Taibaiella chishuiensis]PSK92696.1 tetratricopeptide repeat protein [Taibaiella chishuiensis]
MIKKLLLTTASLCLLYTGAYSQSDKERAQAKAQEALRLEDEEGKVDQAIKLLEEAQQLDPEDMRYPYEIAYAYMYKKEYSKAEHLLQELVKRKNPIVQIYQSLGNVYDYQGKPDLAIETYNKGLKKFPGSGLLYTEMGNVQQNQKAYEKALSFYEKGIAADPAFPANYYRAAKLYCNSSEEVWGMIYGEIFMNLERNTARTAEISKLLYDTYKSEIRINGDTMSVSFSKNTVIIAADAKDLKNFKLPFAAGCYELLTSLSIIGEQRIDIASLNRIRTAFINKYFSEDFAAKYPNILFDYQKKIKDAGFIEAYNYWLLMKGNEEEFNKWQAQNQRRWSAFVTWFRDNQMQVDQSHRFYRFQY